MPGTKGFGLGNVKGSCGGNVKNGLPLLASIRGGRGGGGRGGGGLSLNDSIRGASLPGAPGGPAAPALPTPPTPPTMPPTIPGHEGPGHANSVLGCGATSTISTAPSSCWQYMSFFWLGSGMRFWYARFDQSSPNFRTLLSNSS